MKEDYFQRLYERASRRGKRISTSEIRLVVDQLEKQKPDVDPYALLSILGYTDAKEYRRTVERYLEGPDSFAAKKALSVLCMDWDLSDEYRNELLDFLRGVEWDYDEECRNMAAVCVGVRLRHQPAPELFKELLKITGDNGESNRLRLSAYGALLEAMGNSTTHLPVSASKFNPETDIKAFILKEASERLAREQQKETTEEITSA